MNERALQNVSSRKRPWSAWEKILDKLTDDDQAHGGTMEASNNREGGATFAFTPPANQGDPT